VVYFKWPFSDDAPGPAQRQGSGLGPMELGEIVQWSSFIVHFSLGNPRDCQSRLHDVQCPADLFSANEHWEMNVEK
jgi:hypothetical protein